MIIGVGIDVADLNRFQRLVARGTEGFWGHWYTPTEIDACRRHRHPAYAAAVRFAIKEAALKAVGATIGVAAEEPVRWREIEVLQQAGYVVGLRGGLAAAAEQPAHFGFRVTTCRDHDRVLAAVIAERIDARG